MENVQFDVDGNAFECIECGALIEVKVAEKKPRPISCEECGTEYMVTKKPGNGLSVTIITRSGPELVEKEEEELEEEFEEDADFEKEE